MWALFCQPCCWASVTQSTYILFLYYIKWDDYKWFLFFGWDLFSLVPFQNKMKRTTQNWKGNQKSLKWHPSLPHLCNNTRKIVFIRIYKSTLAYVQDCTSLHMESVTRFSAIQSAAGKQNSVNAVLSNQCTNLLYQTSSAQNLTFITPQSPGFIHGSLRMAIFFSPDWTLMCSGCKVIPHWD